MMGNFLYNKIFVSVLRRTLDNEVYWDNLLKVNN